METRTLLLTLMTVVLIGITLLVIYGLIASGSLSGGSASPIAAQQQSVTLIGALMNGMNSVSLKTHLPKSMNEATGLEFTWTAWLLMDDFTYGTSEHPIFFSNGHQTPSVYYDVNYNAITISQKTYAGEETIRIRNMPSQKMFHLAVVVTQTTLDVFVNGLLHTHKSLESLPILDDGPIAVGPWKGKIGSLTYYNYALSPGEVRGVAAVNPIPNPADEPPNPPYFDTTWWIGRH
jgi:Concanavalin A-like lectin/glucanases superfamily